MGLLSQILGGLAGDGRPAGTGAHPDAVGPGRRPDGAGGGADLGGLGGLGGEAGGPGAGGRTAVLTALLPVVLRLLGPRAGAGSAAAGPGTATGDGGYGGGLDGVAGGLGGPAGFPGGSQAGLGGPAAGGLEGLGGLLARFAQRGHGDAAASWVATGPNQPLSRGMLDDTFDDREISAIAREAGVGEDEARDGLSELLPEVVDHLSPDGRMPPPDHLQAGLDGLLRRLQAS